MYIYKIAKELMEKRISIFIIYREGMGKLYLPLRFYFPLIISFLILIILSFFNLDQIQIKEIIQDINNLIGIILGFSIASFAVFVSIINKNLENESRDTSYTYRQIGSALFFYNVEISLFIYLIGICVINLNISAIDTIAYITNIFNDPNYISKLFTVKGLKFIALTIYIVLSVQLLLNLFFSSLYLNSSIQKKKQPQNNKKFDKT